jgi:hypothetical protein
MKIELFTGNFLRIDFQSHEDGGSQFNLQFSRQFQYTIGFGETGLNCVLSEDHEYWKKFVNS